MDQRLKAMLPLFAAVFIDLFSFGLMYPVIVALFHLPAIEQAYPSGIRGLYLSLAFSLFPLGMFFGAAMLGDLSDALGRKRTLLVCMTGLAVAYALMIAGVQTRNLLWFLAGRVLSGLMAGTAPIAQAAMMDHSSEAQRGRDLSHVVLVNCLALVCGPAAGGLLGHLDFRAPLILAIGMCAIAFVWIRYGTAEATGTRKSLRFGWRRPFQIAAQAWLHPRIRPLATSLLLHQFGFAVYYVYVMIFMTRSYHLSSAGLGLFSALLGVGFVIGSTFAYARAKAWLATDLRVARVTFTADGLLILASTLPLGEAVQWPIAMLIAVVNVPVYIALLALISAAATRDEQGWALGVSSSMIALAYFFAGLLANLLHFVALPVLIAAGGLIVLSGLLPLRGSNVRPQAVRPGAML